MDDSYEEGKQDVRTHKLSDIYSAFFKPRNETHRGDEHHYKQYVANSKTAYDKVYLVIAHYSVLSLSIRLSFYIEPEYDDAKHHDIK